MAKKKVEEPLKQHVETETETPETPLKQHVETETETENYLNPATLNEMIQLRVNEGLSLRVIAEKCNVSLATVGRVLKGVNPLDASEEIEEEPAQISEETDIEAGEEPYINSSPQIPEGYVLRPGITPEQFAKFSKMKKEDLVAQLVESESDRTSLRSRLQLRKGDGEGQATRSTEPPLTTRETIQYAQTQRLLDALTTKQSDNLTEDKIERIVERAVERHGKPDSIDRAVDVVGRLYQQASSSNQGPNPYQIAQNIIGLAKEQASLSGKGSTNELDAKIAYDKMGHDLDMHRLSFEIEKWKMDKQSSADTISAIQDIIKTLGSGVIGDTIKGLGTAAASRINPGGRLPTVDVTCPNCANKFKASPQFDVVTCNACGAKLQKPQESPQPATQPEQQPTPQPQPEPEKPKEKIEEASF